MPPLNHLVYIGEVYLPRFGTARILAQMTELMPRGEHHMITWIIFMNTCTWHRVMVS
jgi:hypothetical protein